jgi:hypothetical protein
MKVTSDNGGITFLNFEGTLTGSLINHCLYSTSVVLLAMAASA